MVLRGLFLGGLLLVSVLSGARTAYAQGNSAAPPAGSQTVAQSSQSGASVSGQLETCRQHVIQLQEQARLQQTKLAGLRAERKTIGTSGGEVARFKLANLDQELRELSKQNQSVNAQVDSEKKRCDSLAAKASSGNRGGAQGQSPGRR